MQKKAKRAKKRPRGPKKDPGKAKGRSFYFWGKMGEFLERKKTHGPIFNSKAGQTKKRPRRPKKGQRRPKKAEKMYFFIVVYTTKAAVQRPFAGGSCSCRPFRKTGTRAQFLQGQVARFGGFQERPGHPNMYDANLCTALQIFRARSRATSRADLDQTWRGGVPGQWLAPKVSPAQSGKIFVTSFFSRWSQSKCCYTFSALVPEPQDGF